MKLISLLVFLCASFPLLANNLHLIDSAPNGFEIYRASEPSAKDMKRFCDLGITEMMVLSGTAGDNELKLQNICPTLKVVYNVKQRTKIPLDTQFLAGFDAWVASAQAAGRKIAFRCNCGCHRTGRLAAYYEMKFKNMDIRGALNNMYKYGKWMFLFPRLRPQSYALRDFIQGKECSVKSKHCVIQN